MPRLMKTVLVGAFWLLIVCTPLLLIVGTFLVIDDEPWIARGYELTPAYIERAEALNQGSRSTQGL